MKIIKLILTALLMLLPLLLFADDCRRHYDTGMRLQRTITVRAQNMAIRSFTDAMACSTDSAFRADCSRQINISRSIIGRLGGTVEEYESPAAATPEVPAVPTEPVDTAETSVESPGTGETAQTAPEQPAMRPAPVNLRFNYDKDAVEFKADGKKTVTVEVVCNYVDWTVTEHPDWLEVTPTADGTAIELKAGRNEGDRREGVVVVTCGDKSVSIDVRQRKAGFLNNLR